MKVLVLHYNHGFKVNKVVLYQCHSVSDINYFSKFNLHSLKIDKYQNIKFMTNQSRFI